MVADLHLFYDFLAWLFCIDISRQAYRGSISSRSKDNESKRTQSIRGTCKDRLSPKRGGSRHAAHSYEIEKNMTSINTQHKD